MKLYQLRAKQYLSTSLYEAWEFLSNPRNLEIITPDHMGFQILSGGDRPMFAGQIIQYRVSPFSGYTTKWVTEITHLKERSYFVDEQRFGPYSFWQHKHFINEIDQGVELEDIIDYKLPFGVLGQWVHPIMIKRQLRQIFRYREQKLIKLFGNIEDRPRELEFKSV